MDNERTNIGLYSAQFGEGSRWDLVKESQIENIANSWAFEMDTAYMFCCSGRIDVTILVKPFTGRSRRRGGVIFFFLGDYVGFKVVEKGKLVETGRYGPFKVMHKIRGGAVFDRSTFFGGSFRRVNDVVFLLKVGMNMNTGN